MCGVVEVENFCGSAPAAAVWAKASQSLVQWSPSRVSRVVVSGRVWSGLSLHACS